MSGALLNRGTNFDEGLPVTVLSMTGMCKMAGMCKIRSEWVAGLQFVSAKTVIGAELCMDWGLQRQKTRNASNVIEKIEFGDLRSCPISPFLAEQNNSHPRQRKKKFLPSLKILRTPQT